MDQMIGDERHKSRRLWLPPEGRAPAAGEEASEEEAVERLVAAFSHEGAESGAAGSVAKHTFGRGERHADGEADARRGVDVAGASGEPDAEVEASVLRAPPVF